MNIFDRKSEILPNSPLTPWTVGPHGAAYIVTALPGSVKPSERSALVPVTVVGPVRHAKTLDTAVYVHKVIHGVTLWSVIPTAEHAANWVM